MTDHGQPLAFSLALEYPYVVVPDEGSYFIEFPDLPGCMTQVEDGNETGAMAEGIRTLWLEPTFEQGMSIPEPSHVSHCSGKFVVRLPRTLHRALAQRAEREGVSINAYVNYLLAERNAMVSLTTRSERRAGALAGQGHALRARIDDPRQSSYRPAHVARTHA